MMRRRPVARAVLAAAVTVLPVATVLAADPPPPPPPQDVWVGKGQVGFVGTQGNTDSRALNAMIDMALLDGPWKHGFHIGGLYGETSGITSAERWDARWQSSYDFTSRLFGFGALRYAHDMFSGFQYQESVTAGVGYKFLDSATTKLTGQIGAGFRRLRPELIDKTSNPPQVYRTPLDAKGEAIVSAGLDFSQVLSGTTTLTDTLFVESGSSNTLITNALGLAVKMSDRLALSLGYSLQNNSKPPAGLKKLDSIETVNLVFSF